MNRNVLVFEEENLLRRVNKMQIKKTGHSPLETPKDLINIPEPVRPKNNKASKKMPKIGIKFQRKRFSSIGRYEMDLIPDNIREYAKSGDPTAKCQLGVTYYFRGWSNGIGVDNFENLLIGSMEGI